ncbi:MAG: hypothetical protein AAB442_02840 [Patescibacteria group bacterium]
MKKKESRTPTPEKQGVPLQFPQRPPVPIHEPHPVFAAIYAVKSAKQQASPNG